MQHEGKIANAPRSSLLAVAPVRSPEAVRRFSRVASRDRIECTTEIGPADLANFLLAERLLYHFVHHRVVESAAYEEHPMAPVKSSGT